jgi:hypothetical protein
MTTRGRPTRVAIRHYHGRTVAIIVRSPTRRQIASGQPPSVANMPHRRISTSSTVSLDDYFVELAKQFTVRAIELAPFSSSASAAFRQAAKFADAARRAAANEVLSIKGAAAESAWHPEALRRRIANDPELNRAVRERGGIRRDELSLLGRGRGKREKRPRRGHGSAAAASDLSPLRSRKTDADSIVAEAVRAKASRTMLARK